MARDFGVVAAVIEATQLSHPPAENQKVMNTHPSLLAGASPMSATPQILPPAPEVQLINRSNIPLPEDTIQRVLNFKATGTPLTGYIGSLSQMEVLMRRARISEEVRGKIIQARNNILTQCMAPQCLFLSLGIVTFFKDFFNAPGTISLCVLDVDSHMRNPDNAASYVSMNKKFHITPFLSQSLSTGLATPLDNSFTLGGFMIIASDFAEERFPASLLHETRHAADIILLEKWIEKAGEKTKSQKVVSPLFKKVVRQGENGPELDEGFYRVFLESRAYYLTYDLLSLERNKLAYAADMTMQDIARFEAVTAPTMREWNITKKSVFKVMKTWDDMIRQDLA